VFRSPLGRYNLLTFAGSAIWCFALAGAGWGLGASYERFHHGFRYADYAVAFVAVLILAFVLAERRRRAQGAAEN
jgi:membrane protein DedA with SNARE-associated domain